MKYSTFENLRKLTAVKTPSWGCLPWLTLLKGVIEEVHVLSCGWTKESWQGVWTHLSYINIKCCYFGIGLTVIFKIKTWYCKKLHSNVECFCGMLLHS